MKAEVDKLGWLIRDQIDFVPKRAMFVFYDERGTPTIKGRQPNAQELQVIMAQSELLRKEYEEYTTKMSELELNHYAKLYEIEHPIETIIGKITTFFERVFRKPSKTAQK